MEGKKPLKPNGQRQSEYVPLFTDLEKNDNDDFARVKDLPKKAPISSARKKQRTIDELHFYNELLDRSEGIENITNRSDIYDSDVTLIRGVLTDENVKGLDKKYKEVESEIKSIFLGSKDVDCGSVNRAFCMVFITYILIFFNEAQMILNGLLLPPQRLSLSYFRLSHVPQILRSKLIDWMESRKIIRSKVRDVAKIASKFCHSYPEEVKRTVESFSVISDIVSNNYLAIDTFYNFLSGESISCYRTLSENNDNLKRVRSNLSGNLYKQTRAWSSGSQF